MLQILPNLSFCHTAYILYICFLKKYCFMLPKKTFIKPAGVIFLLLSTLNILAKIEAKGYLISNAGDTSFVTLLLPTKLASKDISLPGIQDHTKYLNKNGEKIRVSAKDVKEMVFVYENITYHYLSVPESWNTFVSNKMLLRVELLGNCSLLTYYYYNENGIGMTECPVFYKKEGEAYLVAVGTLINISKALNKKSLADYFSDCPLLAGKVNEKAFGKNPYPEIARFYNSSCN